MMKYLIQVLAFLCALLTFTCCLAESENTVLFDYLIEEYNSFISKQTTQHIPIYDNGSDDVYELVLCSTERDSGKMLRSSITILGEQSQDYSWDAFEAGERTLAYVQKLYYVSMVFQQSGYPQPVDEQVMTQLFAECGERMTIEGIDSAYASGEVSATDGVQMLWDVYPFTVKGSDGNIFQTAAYICFELIRKEEDFDGIYRFIIADQMTVCNLFEHMLNLIPDINQQDRELMLLFMEYNRKLENEVGETSSRAIGLIREEYEKLIASASMMEVKSKDDTSDEQERLYLVPAKESDAAFNSFARKRTVKGEAFDNWDMDALVDDLLSTANMAVSINLALREAEVDVMSVTDIVADIINVFGLNLIRFEDWYFYGNDADAGFRWEVIPFCLKIPSITAPGFCLSRPNLYVRMLTLQEDGQTLCEEWIIEDDLFISDLFSGCLEDIEAKICTVMESWITPEEDTSSETIQL